MSEKERKKVGVWPWIAALLVGLPLLYFASFGPACWLVSRTRIGENALPIIYRPMMALMMIDDSPDEVQRRLDKAVVWTKLGNGTFLCEQRSRLDFYPRGYVNKFASLWAAEDWMWRFEIKLKYSSDPLEYSPDPTVRMDERRWIWSRYGSK